MDSVLTGPSPMRAVTSVGVAVLVAALAGCHTYRPLTTATPDAGLDVALQLNDRGNEALRDSIGPEVIRVEGRVASRTDSLVVVRVSHTETASGIRSKWAGEPIGVRPEWVRYAEERQFSRQRTGLVVAAAVGALVLVGTLTDGFGFGGSSDRDPPTEPPPGERRMPPSVAPPWAARTP